MHKRQLLMRLTHGEALPKDHWLTTAENAIRETLVERTWNGTFAANGMPLGPELRPRLMRAMGYETMPPLYPHIPIPAAFEHYAGQKRIDFANKLHASPLAWPPPIATRPHKRQGQPKASDDAGAAPAEPRLRRKAFMKCLQQEAPDMYKQIRESMSVEDCSQGPSTATSSQRPAPPLLTSEDALASEPQAKRPRINLFARGVPLRQEPPQE